MAELGNEDGSFGKIARPIGENNTIAGDRTASMASDMAKIDKLEA
jgi:hypothetical protein